MSQFYCPQPVLTMIIRQRKGETKRQYCKRFERVMDRFERILDMRTKIEEANKRRII